MKAFILAAGVGTRLRPLTYYFPKPMFSVANRPVLEHTIRLLKMHNINEMVINLHYHPQKIKAYFKDGSRWGVKILWSEEKELLGTAGGVKRVEEFLKDDTFIVMSGDGITDLDITKAIDFHHNKHSVATMVLKPVDTRFEYGITLTDSTGRIKKFIEKPAWSEIFSNTVNTGIYIFEPEVLKLIPKNKMFDFGHDLWPLMLTKRMKIYGYLMSDYWCDIGNLTEYRRAQRDILQGKVKLSIPGEKRGRMHIWVGEGTRIDKTVRIFPPVIIGNNCVIEKDVILDKHTVIGNNCRIKRGAKIGNSVLWNDIVVEKKVGLSNCIIGNSAKVVENISVFEGSVINLQKK
ncbi:MAG: NDP-sugar synthase [Elusimicrobiota bacterium]